MSDEVIFEGDVEKVLDMIQETAGELIVKIVENVGRTTSFTIRCEAGYNKDDELVVKVSGSATIPTETKEMEGEILEGKLRLW